MLSVSERCINRIKNIEEIMNKDELKIKNSKEQIKGIFEVSDIMSVSKDLGLSYNTVSKCMDLLIKLKILNIVQSRHRKFRYTKVLKMLEENQ